MGRNAMIATITIAASGDGTLAVETPRNTTAAISWMIRMPIAMRPYQAAASSRDSKSLTANTVLENDRAKPISRALDHSSWSSRGSPEVASTISSSVERIVISTM